MLSVGTYFIQKNNIIAIKKQQTFNCIRFIFSHSPVLNNLILSCRKAIKAALFLLPLLGITNVLVMIEGPTEPVKFALWSYTSHFLVSFQGFIISLLYCFLNGEVSVRHCIHVYIKRKFVAL